MESSTEALELAPPSEVSENGGSKPPKPRKSVQKGTPGRKASRATLLKKAMTEQEKADFCDSLAHRIRTTPSSKNPHQDELVTQVAEYVDKMGEGHRKEVDRLLEP